ncbi:hypothetical protein [Alistipes indistinctus]|uniref:hypothetical protein n=1 Tax=Alistipes indistinctus TaxID=626932 RepID=UPI00351F9243
MSPSGVSSISPELAAAVESRLAALAQAEQIAQGPALQAVHINKYVLSSSACRSVSARKPPRMPSSSVESLSRIRA